MDEQQIVEKIEAVSDAATEKVVEAVPEVLHEVEVVKNNPYILAGVALVAATTGIAVGYKVAEKRLTLKFNEHFDEQMEKTRQHYERRIEDLEGAEHIEKPEPVEEWVHPEKPDAEEQRLLNKYSGAEISKDSNGNLVVRTDTVAEDAEGNEVETKTETRNIFVDGRPIEEFDYEEEMKKRSKDAPYVISEDEFMENSEDFTQLQMTYYGGDDILADEQERTIDAVDELIGNENLARFGHGSKDKNLVYVRNEAKQTEYEIAYSPGKYSVEVLGLDEDESPRIRKFRNED